MAIHELLWAWTQREKMCCGEGMELLGEFQACLISSAFLQACAYSHTHIYKTHISSSGSIFQPRLQKGIKKVPGEVCFGCSETNRQTNKQIKPKSCLKIAFVAYILQKKLIKKYALDFGDPSFYSKRAWFPLCGCFIHSHHRKSLCLFFPSSLFFPFETVDIIRRLTFLSFAIALNRARILVSSPKMVKIRQLGFRGSTEKYFPVSWFSEWWRIRQAGFNGAILPPKTPHFRASPAFGSSSGVKDPSTCFKFQNQRRLHNLTIDWGTNDGMIRKLQNEFF